MGRQQWAYKLPVNFISDRIGSLQPLKSKAVPLHAMEAHGGEEV
jgi:hypothetical protein